MTDLTELELTGDWRVVVESQNAAWNQRVVVSDAEGGTHTVGGVGSQFDVYGLGQDPWRLEIQHDPGSGWAASWVRFGARTTTPTSISQVIESEDTTTPTSDRDFDDLVIRLDKLGMVDQPARPFAVWPASLQMMPEGIIEASLGRYLLAARVRNIFTDPWPAGAAVGLTARCRAWLAASGIQVIDAWSEADLAAVGQQMLGGGVVVGPLAPWASALVYFKVDVSAAAPRKYQVEVEVVAPGPEDLGHLNKRARAPMMVSRTTYDSQREVFVSACDHGTLTAAVKEVQADRNTLLRAVATARRLFGSGGSTSGPAGGPGVGPGCDPRDLDLLRRRLRAFLDGHDDDVCGIWGALEACCGGCGGDGDDGGGSWVGTGATGLEFFVFPTLVEYRVDYAVPFDGQYGPIPYDDPWWKLLLLIIAIILAVAAAVSAAADLAAHSDNAVIGKLTRSVLNALSASPASPPVSADPGSVDVAVTTLDGNRTLTAAIFSYLDAGSGEMNTTPVVALDGHIDTSGATLTNAQLDQIFQNLADHPSDPAAQAAVEVFKSGARTGLTPALLGSLAPVAPRTNGTTIFLLNQLMIVPDPALPVEGHSRPGDSGSLWMQRGTNAIVGLNHAGAFDPDAGPGTGVAFANRIEDVMSAAGIRFA
ncbi:MAG TPA: hypothetical protein VHW26_01655 [Solirubrobacteraceae bacterium]|nr:hypothetical protein [Solirubrobacteraceae bacterium]